MSEVGTLLPPAQRPFGKFELLARLATGGMAELFLARRIDGPDRWAVIKRVLPHLAEDPRFVAMFRDEARLAARLEHPNVCKVIDVGVVSGTYYMALEYLHGVPLSRVLLRAMRTATMIDVRLAAAIASQAAAGLQAAHELTSGDGASVDLVHRDISPPNLFVTADGLVKVLDFGVAKARGATQKTRTGTVKGKNAYMSPEQVIGTVELDRRSDIFSLGICLWESLTATRLFNRDTDFQTFRAIANCEVPDLTKARPETPRELVAVVGRALARDREARFPTAAELGRAITGAMAVHGGVAKPVELAAFVRGHFAAELTAKEELVRAAAKLAPAGS